MFLFFAPHFFGEERTLCDAKVFLAAMASLTAPSPTHRAMAERVLERPTVDALFETRHRMVVTEPVREALHGYVEALASVHHRGEQADGRAPCMGIDGFRAQCDSGLADILRDFDPASTRRPTNSDRFRLFAQMKRSGVALDKVRQLVAEAGIRPTGGSHSGRPWTDERRAKVLDGLDALWARLR